jgi:hypothetical protein
MEDSMKHGHTGISGRVTHTSRAGFVSNAQVTLSRVDGPESAHKTPRWKTRTDAQGRFQFRLEHGGRYVVCASAFGLEAESRDLDVDLGCIKEVQLELEFELKVVAHEYSEDARLASTTRAVAGRRVLLSVQSNIKQDTAIRWIAPRGANVVEVGPHEADVVFSRAGRNRIEASATELGVEANERAEARAGSDLFVVEPEAQTIRGNVGITLQRTASEPTLDQALWVAIRDRTEAISFSRYRVFINRVLHWEEGERLPGGVGRQLLELNTHRGLGAYKVLKTATEIFLMLECGVRIGRADGTSDLAILEEQSRLGEVLTPAEIAARLSEYLGNPPQLPYITRVVETAFSEFEVAARSRDRPFLSSGVDQPCLLELIWSYWHEEGMLMQSINAISQRFQNVRRVSERSPLLHLEIDPLRPVNNLLWGYVQDEIHRLSVARRAAEYLHEYGLSIIGKAVQGLMPLETRSKFLEAFHNLLHQSVMFYRQDFQTTVIADGFPLLNALKEVHLVLAQGANNQFRDLPWTARAEMLVVQYILSRSEIRDFLQCRAMVAYKEAWMPQIDAMKSLHGWTDVSVTHFRDLGVFGEQLLLSIRYGDWIDVNDENSAKNWARYWRAEIQGYVHAYRAATGVDLSNLDAVDPTVPAVYLRKRLAFQQRAR